MLLSTTQIAEKWGVSSRRIEKLCADDRIPEAVRIGSFWAIPEETKKPKDARVKSGKYKKYDN